VKGGPFRRPFFYRFRGMEYKTRERDKDTEALAGDLEPVIDGLGFSLVELSLFRSKKRGSTQVRLVITRPPGSGAPLNGQNGVDTPGSIGTTELSRAHRAILPRLEIAFPGADLYVEVSSPGTDRTIKEGAEFRHFTGRAVKCYRTDTSDWFSGILRACDTEKILLDTGEGITELNYDIIAKAKLDDSTGNI
jgi:ribosome maturation factor RimP